MPRKRMAWVSVEKITTRKGRLNQRTRGLNEADRKVTETLVPAAASVPASSTSRTALWKLWEGNHKRYFCKNMSRGLGKIRGLGDRWRSILRFIACKDPCWGSHRRNFHAGWVVEIMASCLYNSDNYRGLNTYCVPRALSTLQNHSMRSTYYVYFLDKANAFRD